MAQINYLDNGLVFITKVSGTGVASLSVDGCFTNKYTQYKIIADFTSVTGGNTLFRFRIDGSDHVSAEYNYQRITVDSTSVSGGRSTTATFWNDIIYHETSVKAIANIEVLNPFQTTYATGFAHRSYIISGNIGEELWGYGMDVTTSFDGFSLYPQSADTFTGDVYVYGYKQS